MDAEPLEKAIKEAAWLIAVRCRHVIQGLLRDEEQGDCDREFSAIAEEVLQKLTASTHNG